MKYEELPTDAKEALNEISKEIVSRFAKEKGLDKKMKELTLAEAIEALKAGKKVKFISPVMETQAFHLNKEGDFVNGNDKRGVVTFGFSQELCKNISDLEKALSKKRFILVEDILDKKEKEYLGNIVRPFKRKIKDIRIEKKAVCGRLSRILIYVPKKDEDEDADIIEFPMFNSDNMYRGMEPNKQYNLGELGL